MIRIVKRLLFLLLIVLIISCEKDGGNNKYEPLVTRFEASERFPHGYSDVIMGDSMMRVPHDITTVIDINGNIGIFYIWPEFSRYEKVKRSGLSNDSKSQDKIQIFIRPPRRGPNAGDQYLAALDFKRSRIIQLENDNWVEASEIPGYLKLSNNSAFNYYKPSDDYVVDPLGLGLIFVCITEADRAELSQRSDMVTDKNDSAICSTAVRFEDNHLIRIRFNFKHLKDALIIYQKVIMLHNSLLIN